MSPMRDGVRAGLHQLALAHGRVAAVGPFPQPTASAREPQLRNTLGSLQSGLMNNVLAHTTRPCGEAEG